MTEAEYLASEDPAVMMDYLESMDLVDDRRFVHFIETSRAKYIPEYVGATTKNNRQSLIEIHTGQDEFLHRFDREWDPVYSAALIREIWGNPWKPWWMETSETLYGKSIARNCHRKAQEVFLLEQMTLKQNIFYRSWLTPEVIAMARLIHDTQDWDLMPIFADLLEDAGCDNEDVLRHARGEERQLNRKTKLIASDCEACGAKVERREDGIWCPSCYWYRHDPVEQSAGWIPARAPHVRGCWLLSLITGDE